MDISTIAIKLFPAYEDVFYDELEMHQKHFLPLCSVMFPLAGIAEGQWLHFVSVKELYDGRVGEQSHAYHTRYSQPDTFAFDVIDGKYKFDADWRFFDDLQHIEPEAYQGNYSDHEIAYNMNESMYALKKAYYQQFRKLYQGDFNRPGLMVDDIRRLERLRALSPDDLNRDPIDNYLVERQQHKKSRLFDNIYPDLFPDEGDVTAPVDEAGTPFTFIGNLDGYDFQHHAPENICLFYDQTLQKAVVCLGNS
ncbi:hypothetical protein [Chitinophaga flava]|uniref:Uncharacterized protein n=1 Tax=Chitinophaga flava TaxID=2259036 RepID=A0A365XX82_9BACT|nr:hypothetical protein [Chitinophaga flava]RBL90611.1 hypothetical protein DF182_29595 [Chitinophaga flava]